MKRVIAYIDGFNLYFGLREKEWRRYYWLNIQKLAQSLLKEGQYLKTTKYFTSRVKSTVGDPEKYRRQSIYLEAIGTLPDCQTYYGHYLSKIRKCRRCGHQWEICEEKMTDVNIAVELMEDALKDNFDAAFLITGDSDLSGPVRKIKELFPLKRIIVAFPPRRSSMELKKISDAYFTVGRKKIADSQFPPEVKKTDGFILKKPKKWK